MKKIFLGITLLSVFSIIAFSFTYNNEDIIIGEKSGEENVITADEATLNDAFDRFDIFEGCTRQNFEIKLFEFEDEQSQYFLYANGTNADDKPVTMRISLKQDGNNFTLAAAGVLGESCTGDPCEHCKFKKKGGCDCTTWGNVCNHSISKD